ncbi:MAG: S-layer homology domain-containing protein [Paenibacillaceae bacterium]
MVPKGTAFIEPGVVAFDNVDGFLSEQVITEDVNFNDIEGNWAYSSSMAIAEKGILNGYEDGTFQPKASVTRAEFTVMLVNALQPTAQEGSTQFKDAVPAWANNAIARAVSAGWVSGYEDHTFRANEQITRAEMTTIVARALGLTPDPVNESLSGFADDGDIPVWAKGSVTVAKQQGIISGSTGNKFHPQDIATRAEAVTVIMEIIKGL